jgi:methionyl-tRNA formyltransferase
VKPLRIIVMGTGPFAVPMFAALLRAGHEIVAVVTRPDHAPPGRRPAPNPMRQAAAEAGLPVLDPERVNDPESVARLAALRPDLFVVCDYGQILSASLLAVPPLGGINLHGSLLPRHRGAAPIQWAILEGDAETGVSVIHMTPALDAGNVIAVRPVGIGARETAAAIEPRLAEVGAESVIEGIERLQAAWACGSVAGVGVPQDAARATRAPRLAKSDGIVDWTWPAERIERLRRAVEPWPRATTFFRRGEGQTQRLVLEDVEVVPAESLAGEAGVVAPGTVLSANDERIVVACGADTALAILRLVPEGRRSMSAAEFLRGSPLRTGVRLG